MAEKSRMACNRPVASDRPGKKKMVKACANGQEKLLHFGAKGYKSNIAIKLDLHLEHAILVILPRIN
jgi:hypothetical protein